MRSYHPPHRSDKFRGHSLLRKTWLCTVRDGPPAVASPRVTSPFLALSPWRSTAQVHEFPKRPGFDVNHGRHMPLFPSLLRDPTSEVVFGMGRFNPEFLVAFPIFVHGMLSYHRLLSARVLARLAPIRSYRCGSLQKDAEFRGNPQGNDFQVRSLNDKRILDTSPLIEGC